MKKLATIEIYAKDELSDKNDCLKDLLTEIEYNMFVLDDSLHLKIVKEKDVI